MPVDAEREITRLHNALGLSQGITKSTHYQWRQAALELAGPGVDPVDVTLKFWEIARRGLNQVMLSS
ncbi:MAG: hypothetical protein UY81_C0052G0002 [Candidatus Giovannonibacteria bacterium GW2011_GWA2_53_7]|uniref:Uncharacterized protein n=1 Tax=Candidatus Giovannonibacteria bacterium GW2011_GWA2_53_7 TaxID=1618650 RepID=A0A0G2A2S2_9BACT|nr:MAG: hypothetical protein UY81_C0052G0002 [Candidatus Giovannonibacteria bacterium GW2011_GWA2_53_7]